MSPKFTKLFFLDSPGKIEVNPYPNRQKSPRIRRCGGAQKKVKSAVFGGSEDLEKDSRHLTNMPENLSLFEMDQNIENIARQSQNNMYRDRFSIIRRLF